MPSPTSISTSTTSTRPHRRNAAVPTPGPAVQTHAVAGVVGFPEVQLGLLPGAGGVVRSVRMLGLVSALMSLLLQGQRLRLATAKELGVVDQIVATRDDLPPAAKAWISAQNEDFAGQPWD